MQIYTSAKCIDELCRLLAKRRNGKITRQWFLRRWTQIRAVLAYTYEYAELRQLAFARAGNQCQGKFCTARATVMDHIEQVSMNPERALDKTNVRVLCEACHVAKHPHLQRRQKHG